MSTYRERRERKVERLDEWAEGRDRKADAAHAEARRIGDVIPLGQPVLVGHHSQRRHERDLDRIDSNMRASVESSAKADDMRSRADNIRAQLDVAIFDDDPDAVERLTERIAALTERRDAMKARNARYRQAHKAELRALNSAFERDRAMPHPSFEITNMTSNINRLRKRLQSLSAPECGRPLVTRYAGECRTCGAAIEPGDHVLYFRRSRAVECTSCSTPPEAA